MREGCIFHSNLLKYNAFKDGESVNAVFEKITCKVYVRRDLLIHNHVTLLVCTLLSQSCNSNERLRCQYKGLRSSNEGLRQPNEGLHQPNRQWSTQRRKQKRRHELRG
jgi:hypothetical protein